MFPSDVTAKVLGAFRNEFPTVALQLNIEGLGAVAQCLLDEDADLAVGGPVIGDHPALEKLAIGEIDLVPVAAPDYPLTRAVNAGTVRPGDSRKHLQLVLADRSDLTEGREFSVLSPHTWRLGDLGAKHSLLLHGLGWGNMPRAMIAGDLESGALVELDLPEAPGDHYLLRALWRRDFVPGPAARWLIEKLKEGLAA